MAIKIMIRATSNKIITMVSIQAWNSMTSIIKSNKMVMLDRIMAKDNIIKNSTMKININNKTKFTIMSIIEKIKTINNTKTTNIILITRIKTTYKTNLFKTFSKTLKNKMNLLKIYPLII